MINNLKDINLSTPEGKLLFAALIKLSTESQADRHPDEIIAQCNVLVKVEDLFFTEEN